MKRLEIFRLFPSVDPATFSLLPVLDQYHEGIIVTDSQGIVLYRNDTPAMIDDLKADDASGKKVIHLYRVDEGASPTKELFTHFLAKTNARLDKRITGVSKDVMH